MFYFIYLFFLCRYEIGGEKTFFVVLLELFFFFFLGNVWKTSFILLVFKPLKTQLD